MLTKNILSILVGAAVCTTLACEPPKKKTDVKADAPKTATQKDTKKDDKGSTIVANKTAPSKPAESAAPILPFSAKGPIAKIGGKEISAKLFNDEVTKLAPMAAMMPADRLETIKGQMVDNLINKEIVEMAVAKTASSVDAKEVETEFKKFVEQVSKQPGGVQGFYQRAGMTEADIKGDMRKGIALKAMLAKSYDVKVANAEVKKFYNENKARFEEKGQVQASHILFKADGKDKAKLAAAKKKANDAYKAAKKKGADFGELAKKLSEGPSAPKGGDLGFFTKERMVPEFSAAAFKGKKGQILKPVKTQFGYHVIKVVDKKDGRTVPFAEVKDGILRQLEMPKMKDAMEKFLTAQKLELKVEKLSQNVVNNPEFKAKPAAPMGMPPGMKMPPGMGKMKMPDMKKLKMPKITPKKLELKTK